MPKDARFRVDARLERNGTVVTLSDLNSTLNFPNPEKLRQILVLEYGRTENFQIFVNGEQLKIEDIPGENFTFEEEAPQVGHIRLHFTVSDGPESLKQSGIVITRARQTGRKTVLLRLGR